MSKYDPLQRYLSRLESDDWSVDFAELETILGFSLPPSAGSHQAWWANQTAAGHSQKQAWHGAGWQTCDVDLPARRVRFRRVRPAVPSFGISAMAGQDRPADHVYEEARRFLGIATQEELVREGVKALIEREAARQLAALGGSMPDFVPPPRRRSQ